MSKKKKIYNTNNLKKRHENEKVSENSPMTSIPFITMPGDKDLVQHSPSKKRRISTEVSEPCRSSRKKPNTVIYDDTKRRKKKSLINSSVVSSTPLQLVSHDAAISFSGIISSADTSFLNSVSSSNNKMVLAKDNSVSFTSLPLPISKKTEHTLLLATDVSERRHSSRKKPNVLNYDDTKRRKKKSRNDSSVTSSTPLHHALADSAIIISDMTKSVDMSLTNNSDQALPSSTMPRCTVDLDESISSSVHAPTFTHPVETIVNNHSKNDCNNPKPHMVSSPVGQNSLPFISDLDASSIPVQPQPTTKLNNTDFIHSQYEGAIAERSVSQSAIEQNKVFFKIVSHYKEALVNTEEAKNLMGSSTSDPYGIYARNHALNQFNNYIKSNNIYLTLDNISNILNTFLSFIKIPTSPASFDCTDSANPSLTINYLKHLATYQSFFTFLYTYLFTRDEQRCEYIDFYVNNYAINKIRAYFHKVKADITTTNINDACVYLMTTMQSLMLGNVNFPVPSDDATSPPCSRAAVTNNTGDVSNPEFPSVIKNSTGCVDDIAASITSTDPMKLPIIGPTLSFGQIKALADEKLNEGEALPYDLPINNLSREELVQLNVRIHKKIMDGMNTRLCPRCCCNYYNIQFKSPRSTFCTKCSNRWGRYKYADSNHMQPSPLPQNPSLPELSTYEELLIAPINPCLVINRLKYGQNSMSGHSIFVNSDTCSFVERLPRTTAPVILVAKQRADGRVSNMKVRRDAIRVWLEYLVENNPYYRERCCISQELLDQIPVDDYGTPMAFIEDQSADNVENENFMAETSVGDSATLNSIPNYSTADRISHAIAEENILPYPAADINPVNEFTTKGLFSLAFPTLFPDGKAEYNSHFERRGENKVELKEWVTHLLSHKEPRFREHLLFKFVALDMVVRWQLLANGRLVMKSDLCREIQTVEEMRNALQNRNFRRKINMYNKNVPGSLPYLKNNVCKLTAAIMQYGMPHLFTTFSNNDHNWAVYYDLYNVSTRAELHKAMIKNPFPATLYFKTKLNVFLDEVFKGYFNIKEYYYRIEFQSRGSIHAHCLMWCNDGDKFFLPTNQQTTSPTDNCPSIAVNNTKPSCHKSNVFDKPLHNFSNPDPSSNEISSSNPPQYTFKRNLLIPPINFSTHSNFNNNTTSNINRCNGENVTTSFNTNSNNNHFFDNTTTSNIIIKNNFTPQSNVIVPIPNICASDETEYARIVKGNLDGRFVRGVADAYICNKNKYFHTGETFNVSELTGLSPEEIDDVKSHGEKVIHTVGRHTMCGSHCLNSQKHCRFKFPKPPCNKTNITLNEHCDFELNYERDDPYIINHHDIFAGLWNGNIELQIVLSEGKVKAYLLKYIFKPEKNSQFHTKLIHLLSNSSRKLQAIQRVFNLLHTRNISAQETAVFLMQDAFCDGTFKFNYVNTLPSDSITQYGRKPSDLKRYSEREPQYESLSLFQYFKLFFFDQKGNRKEHSSQDFVLVGIPYAKAGSLKYFQRECILHIPFRGDPEQIKAPDDSWHLLYSRLKLPYKVKFDFNQNDFSAMPASGLGSDNFTNTIPLEETDTADDLLEAIRDVASNYFTIAANLNIQVFPNHDWRCNKNILTKAEIDACLAQIKSYNETAPPDQDSFDISSLNDQQRTVFHHIIDRIESPIENEPLRLILNGPGGTGKSFIIKALRRHFDNNVLVASFTGAAARLVDGMTIHNLFHIPVNEFKPLDAKTIKQLRKSLIETKLVIIDEFSLLSANIIGKIDFRIREAFPEYSERRLANINFLLCGDLHQLPPVAEHPPYSNAALTDELSLNGQLTYQSFNQSAFLTTIVRQQNDPAYGTILAHVRDGTVSNDDLEFLKQLKYNENDTVNNVGFENATFLCSTNADCATINTSRILRFQSQDTPVAIMISEGSYKRAKTGSYKYMLLAQGARIMLKRNISVRCGLVNGAMGFVRHIIYINKKPPQQPECILVEFDNYSGPTVLNNLVPIVPQVEEDQETRRRCVTCLPIKLAYAVSIHKSQGMTLPKVIVDLGKNEKWSGLAYVALSRVKTSSDIRLMNFLPQRLLGLANNDQYRYKAKEMQRLKRFNIL